MSNLVMTVFPGAYKERETVVVTKSIGRLETNSRKNLCGLGGAQETVAL
jgi:hypothetical protein